MEWFFGPVVRNREEIPSIEPAALQGLVGIPDHDRPHAVHTAQGSAALSVNKLEVLYSPKGSPAIEEVSLSAKLGEVVLLSGPNGGGKTTLLRAMAGILRPSRGEVLVLGRDPFRDLSVRKLIGYVPQFSDLNIHVPLTVWDLVALGRYAHLGPLGLFRRADREEVEKSLGLVGLADKASAKLSELSGGQLSRALLAKAMAQDPVVYLLDEPFESIDQPTESLILEVLKKQAREGKLVVIAEHHIADFTEFDRVILLNKRIIAEGKPSEVLTEDKIKAAYGTAH